MSRPAVTLVKGTEHHEFFLSESNKDGGRLHEGTIQKVLKLENVKFRFGGDSKFGSIAFDSRGLSLDRFPAGAKIEVSGDAAAAAQPQPGAMSVQAGGAAAGMGARYSLYEPVTRAVFIKFSIMGARRNDRSMLKERMEAHSIRGTIRRVSPQEVTCVAVVPPHQVGSLDKFMEDVFKVAPLLDSADEDEPHSVLAPGNPKGPVVSDAAEMLQLLAKPVTVYQVATTVRNACVDDPSRISDDPEGAVSTISSLPSSQRYGP